MESWNRDFRLEFKGEVDLVTEVDRDAEEIILKRLKTAFKEDSIVAEEGGGGIGRSQRTWYIDPLTAQQTSPMACHISVFQLGW